MPASSLDEGYRRIQVKVGTDPLVDAERLAAVRDLVGSDVVLYADANGAFTTSDARRFLRATRDLEYVLEQPCRTYAECAALRGDCGRPLVLDESIVTLDDLLRAARERVADGVTLKLQRIGGVSRARLMRDVAVEHGLDVTIEDAGGSSLATAAFVHLGLGTPERHRAHMVDFHRWVSVDHGTGLPAERAGHPALRRTARASGSRSTSTRSARRSSTPRPADARSSHEGEGHG